jgi:hypothetical protein
MNASPLATNSPRKNLISICLTAAVEWANRFPLITIAFILFASAVPLLFVVNAPVHGDVLLYQGVVNDAVAGKLPYRDRVVEYPPYALPFFGISALFGAKNYQQSFAVFVVLGDSLIKCLLLWFGFRENNKRAFVPLLIYCITVPFIRYFYLQRYDVFPALITLAIIWCFSSRRHFLTGVLIAIGTGVKLYPILFAPILFFLAREHRRALLLGFVAGILPIALLGIILPWWRFLAFHNERGLQVESLYASILWFGRLLGLNDVKWAWAKAWMEIQGTAATAILAPTRWLFLAAVAVSAAFASWAALRMKAASPAMIARVLLIPLTAFIAFNQVLSPQYLIWLLPLAALASLEGDLKPAWAISLATMLTPIFYPSPEYVAGLGLFQSLILLGRNLMLIAIWMLLIRDVWRSLGVLKNTPVEPRVEPKVP